MSDTGTFRIKALGELQGFEDGETFNGVFLEGSIPAIRSVGTHLLEDVAIVPASSLHLLVEALKGSLGFIEQHYEPACDADYELINEVRAALASIKGGQ